MKYKPQAAAPDTTAQVRSKLTASKPPSRRHDQYVHYSHEMSEDTAESAARALIRAVPLVYGALLGGLIGSLGLGLALGLTMTVALDWRMGDKSLFRPLLRPLAVTGCPCLSWLMRGIARGLGRMRLPVPAKLLDLHCGGA